MSTAECHKIQCAPPHWSRWVPHMPSISCQRHVQHKLCTKLWPCGMPGNGQLGPPSLVPNTLEMSPWRGHRHSHSHTYQFVPQHNTESHALLHCIQQAQHLEITENTSSSQKCHNHSTPHTKSNPQKNKYAATNKHACSLKQLQQQHPTTAAHQLTCNHRQKRNTPP